MDGEGEMRFDTRTYFCAVQGAGPLRAKREKNREIETRESYGLRLVAICQKQDGYHTPVEPNGRRTRSPTLSIETFGK